MTLSFRNVDANVSDHVATWPQEAIAAALERGDISHWRRIAAEIRRSPWGGTARAVAEVLTHSRPYGVAELMGRAITEARDVAVRSEVDEVAGRIQRLVAVSGLSTSEFASRVGTSRSRLSTYLSGKVVPSAALLVRMERAAGDSTARD